MHAGLLSEPELSNQETQYLSVREAAERYGLAQTSLERRLRNGEIDACKERGLRGWEWRVSVAALEEFGYALPSDPPPTPVPDVDELQATVRRLRDVATFERRRAEEADRRLGEAMQEIGRLRSMLRRAEEQSPPASLDLRERPTGLRARAFDCGP